MCWRIINEVLEVKGQKTKLFHVRIPSKIKMEYFSHLREALKSCPKGRKDYVI